MAEFAAGGFERRAMTGSARIRPAPSASATSCVPVTQCMATRNNPSFLEVYIDNTNARLKWQQTVKSSWIVAGTVGAANLLLLGFLD